MRFLRVFTLLIAVTGLAACAHPPAQKDYADFRAAAPRSKAPTHEWAAKALRSSSNCSSTGLVLSAGGALAAGA